MKITLINPDEVVIEDKPGAKHQYQRFWLRPVSKMTKDEYDRAVKQGKDWQKGKR